MESGVYWLQLEEDVCPEGMKRAKYGRIGRNQSVQGWFGKQDAPIFTDMTSNKPRSVEITPNSYSRPTDS